MYFVFREIFWTCVLRINLSSLVIPSRTTSKDFSILHFIQKWIYLNVNICSQYHEWNLPGFGFNKFTLSHFKIYPKSNLRLSPYIFQQEFAVLSSAILHMFGFETKKSISFLKMLNNKRPTIDPCCIPKIASHQSLKLEPIFILCFWLLR